MYASHPFMTEPTDETKLWRYMDITKFLAMLESSSLYYSQIDELGDPYEGKWSRAYADSFREQFGDEPVGIKLSKETIHYSNLPAGFEKSFVRQRAWLYVSCWHASEHESAAMWSLYTRSGQGVAIRTTFSKFKESTSKEKPIVIGGLVNYIDFESESLPIPSYLHWGCTKRLSFEHEKEFRSLVFASEEEIAPEGEQPPGIQIQVGLQTLIEEVYVSPTSPSWFTELIKKILTRYGLEIPVSYSPLLEAPEYMRDTETLDEKLLEAEAYQREKQGESKGSQS